ncbi:MAG: hypothetical protein L6R36_008276 [Xanthoria steineri]|nr:MAG: hypothetical protein L6R36_008276 [Xanthoria steineri]
MTLVSYRVARRLSRYSANRQIENLPTTYQLGLLFESFEAKLTSLWDTLWYLVGKRRHRINGLLSYTLTFLLLASTLSTVIWAVDTWFQVTMSAVVVSQMSPSKSAAQAYGDKIPDTCISSFNRATLMAPESCDGPVYLGDPYQIIMNVSSHRQILTGSYNGTDFSFLAPANPRPDIDFKATTFAASSSCYPISRRCNMAFQYSNEPTGERTGGLDFNCSENFKGNVDFFRKGNQEYYSMPCVNNQAGCVGFFSDSSLNIPFNNTSFDHTLNAANQRQANPFFAGVLGYFIISDGTTGLQSDPEVSPGVGKWFILGCEITIHEYTYIWINNTITSGTITPASDEVAAVVRQVITLNDPSAYQQFAYNVQLSTFMSNTSSQIAASYSQHLEKTLLAWSAASWEPTPTQQEQIRRNLLVTRVPKTPLFTLVTLCLLFVALSITITVIVLLDESGPTSECQSRLNVFGLVASRFDGAERRETSPGSQEDGSEEGEGRSDDTKIGIVKTRLGGWNYVAF